MPKKRAAKTAKPVEEVIEAPKLTLEQQEQLDQLREGVFDGILWSGWHLNRRGLSEATLVLVYQINGGEPVGVKRPVSVPSTESDVRHREALRDKVVELVEDFVTANMTAQEIIILTTSPELIEEFRASPLSQAGPVANALAAPAEPEPDVEVTEEGTALPTFTEADRAAVHAEVFTKEFGSPAAGYKDVLRDRLTNRLS